MNERMNLIAFFCHSLGITPDKLPEVETILKGYEHDHHHLHDDDVLDAREVADE